MNKFLELEKRFEKVMKSIEKLHFKQSNEEVSSEINDVSTAQKLSNDQIILINSNQKYLYKRLINTYKGNFILI